MSKYQPLSDHLTGRSEDQWQASFAELEEVLGFPLPKGARSQRVWWSDDKDAEKPHKRAWQGAGWRVGHVDPAAETVTFHRIGAEEQGPMAAPALEETGGEAAQPRGEPARRAAPPAAAVAGAAAVVAGLGALLMRRVLRRR